MIIEKEKIQLAKEKLGDRNAEIIRDVLLVENWDEKNKKGCCPFHNENTPSFIYNPKKLNAHCFGCSRTVDVIDAYMYSGKTYMEAVQLLFEEAKIPYSFGELGVRTQAQYRYPKAVPLNDKTHVYEYLQKRGISKKTIDDADVREDEHGNIVFNYYDINDVLMMIKYRPSHKIDKTTGEVKSWCQKDADTCPLLFNMNRVNTEQPLLITEGEIDTLAAIEAGWTNAVSVPLGSQNTHWIEHNYEWLEQFSEIIICSDNDEAGIKMRKEVVPRLGSWRTKYIDIPLTVSLPGNPSKSVAVKDLNEILYWCGKQKVMELILNAQESGVPSVTNVSEIRDVDLEDIDGVETGIKELDKEIMRLFYGTLTVVSGKPGCVDKETEYFNGTRWVKISDYRDGDKVLQYNADGTAELVTPLQYIKVPCDKFYHLHTKYGVDQMVSEDHTVVYAKHDKDINKIVMRDLYQRHLATKSGFSGKIISDFIYSGPGIDISDEVIRLMCAVIADGNFGRNTTRCQLNLKKQRKKERIKKLLNDCGIPYKIKHWSRDPEIFSYVFYAPMRIKEFPMEWYYFNQHQQDVFLNEVFRWDGSTASNTLTFSTSVKSCADFVQFMSVANGVKARVYQRNRVGQLYNAYNQAWTRKRVEYIVKVPLKHIKSNGIICNQRQAIQTFSSEDGYKYCFTVPSGMLVLRRNGCVNITGNSGKTSFLSQLVCQALDQNINCMMFSRELPAFLQRGWIQSVMAGPSHTMEFENKNGTKYYKVTNDAKTLINKVYDKRWYLYNDDASNKLEDILSSMESCLRKYSTRLIILDNLMTIDVQSSAENELQKQTECITKLIEFAIKWQAAIVLVCHPRKMDADSDVGIYDIAGTSNIINLAHRTFSLRRIDKEKEKTDHDVVLTLIKDRLYGNANKRIFMYYDVPSRRFYTNEEEYNHQYLWDKSTPIKLPYPHPDETEVFGEVKHVAV